MNPLANATVTSEAGTRNWMMDVTTYWRISGLALAAVALLGILLNAMGSGTFIGGFLEFDWTHNMVHVVLAALALTLGFATVDRSLSVGLAKVVGTVYLLLGVVGFISADLFGLGDAIGLHLELGENLVHIVIGAWGAWAGFSS